METYIYGMDLSNNFVHTIKANNRGHEISRHKVDRMELEHFMDTVPKGSTICIESCSGSHKVAKEAKKRGLKCSAIPAQHTERFRVKQKNDYNDAKAILTAYLHEDVKPSGMKTDLELDIQIIHRKRELLKKQHLEVSNSVRGYLKERGRTLRGGEKALREYLSERLEADTLLTPSFIELLKNSFDSLLRISDDLDRLDKQLRHYSQTDPTAKMVKEIPGVGIVISTYASTLKSQIHLFKNGRAFTAAKVGTIPRQHSTGGVPHLGGITKKGDKYLRSILVQGAQSLIMRAPKNKDPLSLWIQELLRQKHRNVVAIAVANKLARIIWLILAKEKPYDPAMTNGQLPQSVQPA